MAGTDDTGRTRSSAGHLTWDRVSPDSAAEPQRECKGHILTTCGIARVAALYMLPVNASEGNRSCRLERRRHVPATAPCERSSPELSPDQLFGTTLLSELQLVLKVTMES